MGLKKEAIMGLKKEAIMWLKLIGVATLCYGLGDTLGNLYGTTKLFMFWSGMAYAYYLNKLS